MSPHISIIIPCYNEGPHLSKSLEMLSSVLSAGRAPYEIIFVDDKSTDDTVSIIKNFKQSHGASLPIRVIEHALNEGRGKTVSDGLSCARGDIAGFVDIDFSTSPWYVFPLVAAIEQGADVVIGQRFYKFNLRVLHRWVISKGYKILVRLLLGTDLGDTESGCKFFNTKKILPILPHVKDHRWFWDTEIIARSVVAGLTVREVPTLFIRESIYTRVKIIRDSWRHFVSLVQLAKDLKTKHVKK